jgi:hypothetical protein
MNSLQQSFSCGGVGGQRDLSGLIGLHLDAHHQISAGNESRRFFRPFCQFEAGTGKDVAKSRIFPFARVAEAVEVKVPDVERWRIRSP